MQDVIDGALDRRLFLWEPILPGPHTRIVYVEKDLYEAIMQPSAEDGFRIGALWRDLDHFSRGEQMTVGYGSETTCRIKPLDPIADEVWELRSRDPEPQVRVFGRFCGPNELVATHAVFRDDLGDPSWSKWDGNRWPVEILRCQRIWAQIFHSYPPHSGGDVHAYITSNVVEVGKLP